MKQLLVTIFLFCCISCFAQRFPPGDSLSLLTYDTVRVETENGVKRFELENKRQFSFCSQLYNIPQYCNAPDVENCCKYSTNIYEIQKVTSLGSINCLNAFPNGYDLTWIYAESISAAKMMVENYSTQLEKQWISFKKRIIKCHILNKEFPGYLYESIGNGNIKLYRILTYGSFKQYNFSLDYLTMSKLTDSNDIPTNLKEIISFE